MTGRRHEGQPWPYHMKKNGSMAPCASNPCQRHSIDDDTVASSLEEAYALKRRDDQTIDAYGRTLNNRIVQQQELLTRRLADYAPEGWNGVHFEKTNGGQLNEWQGREYRDINRHLDAVENDPKINVRTKEQYKRFVASELYNNSDHYTASGRADEFPAKFLLSDEARRRAVSLDGVDTSALEYGIEPHSVQSGYALRSMFYDRRKGPLNLSLPDDQRDINAYNRYRDSLRTDENPRGDPNTLIRHVATTDWGQHAMYASESAAMFDDADSARRHAVEELNDWNNRMRASGGFGEHLDTEVLGGCGTDPDSSLWIKRSLSENHEVNESTTSTDIRMVANADRRHQVAQMFQNPVVAGTNRAPGHTASLENRKQRRCAAYLRCNAIARNMHRSVSQVYAALLADSKTGGDAIYRVMTGDFRMASSAVMTAYGRHLND